MEGLSEGSRVRVRVSRVRVVAGSKKGFTFRELTRLQSPPYRGTYCGFSV